MARQRGSARRGCGACSRRVCVWRLSEDGCDRALFSGNAGGEAFAAGGGLVLGICNGFQILTEAGLLPGALMRNAGLKYICKRVHSHGDRGQRRSRIN